MCNAFMIVLHQPAVEFAVLLIGFGFLGGTCTVGSASQAIRIAGVSPVLSEIPRGSALLLGPSFASDV